MVPLEEVIFMISEIPSVTHNFKEMTLSEMMTKVDYHLRPILKSIPEMLNTESCSVARGGAGAGMYLRRFLHQLTAHKNWSV